MSELSPATTSVTPPPDDPSPPAQGAGRATFVAALLCFALAAATGVLLRYGVLHGLPWGLEFVHVRHAHTHLMYFGWVTPALFALIGVTIARRARHPLPRAYHLSVAAALVVGLLAFPPFLLSGYGLLTVGETRLPLSMIASALAVLTWYAWTVAYVVVGGGLRRDLALLTLDAAALALLVSSAGAWGLAALGLAPAASPALMDALVRFYLDLFSNGWFALAVLGLLLAQLPAPPDGLLSRVALGLAVGGLLIASFAPLLTWPVLLEGGGRVVAAMALATLAYRVTIAAKRDQDVALASMAGLLLAKVLVDAALVVPLIADWSARSLLHVPLLHAYLLGVVSLTLMLLGLRAYRPAVRRVFMPLALTVVVLMLSLLPLTMLWPAPWRGPWVLPAALWGGVPVTVAGLVLAAVLATAPRR